MCLCVVGWNGDGFNVVVLEPCGDRANCFVNGVWNAIPIC